MGGKKSNRIRKLWRSIRTVRTWQLIIILIPLLFLSATLLRFDHLRMADLRDQVLAADQAIGNLASDASPEEVAATEDALATALSNLRTFTFSHTVLTVTENNGIQSFTLGTGPFYLEHQYRRAANAAIAAAESNLASDANPHGNIYEAVRQICQPLAIANGWAWSSPGYLNCWTTELAKYPASDNLANPSAAIPSTELYRKNYASPIWSPTATGFVLLLTTLLAIFVLSRLLIKFLLFIVLLFLDR